MQEGWTGKRLTNISTKDMVSDIGNCPPPNKHFPNAMVSADKSLRQSLLHATEGLLYPSESDEPLVYFEWDLSGNIPLNEQAVRKYTGKPRQVPVEKQSLEDFFKSVTEAKDWYGEDELKQAEQFKALQRLITENLTDIQVFRVGRTDIDVYVVGKTPSGKWAGVATKVVET